MTDPADLLFDDDLLDDIHEPERAECDPILDEFATTDWSAALPDSLKHKLATFPFAPDHLFSEALRQGASDVHIHKDQPISLRINGLIVHLDQDTWPWLNEATIHDLPDLYLGNIQVKRLIEKMDAREPYEIRTGPYKGRRFRLHIGKETTKGSENSYYMVARAIPEHVPTPESLGIPDNLLQWTKRRGGITFVSGATGSGKSNTLAAMLNHTLKTQPIHLFTVEDPVEFIYPHHQGIVTQRDATNDTQGYAGAFENVLRDDSNVMLIGETRTYEQAKAVLNAIESGGTVYTTIHADSAAGCITRFTRMFEHNPGEQQGAIKLVTSKLTGIINQILLPTPDGSRRFAVREVLEKTPASLTAIKQGEEATLQYLFDTKASMAWQVGQAIATESCDLDQALMVSWGLDRFPEVMESLNLTHLLEPSYAPTTRPTTGPSHLLGIDESSPS